MISKNKILVFIFLVLVVSCGHSQKVGELIIKEDLDTELKTLDEINFLDKKKLDQFLKTIRRELSLVKRQEKIPLETWNKIGQLLEIYKSMTQFYSQNKILIPSKTKLILRTASFCIDPNRSAPDSREIFQWIYGDPSIPFYGKILKYYQMKNGDQKDLIQELIWNLANGTYYEDYPEKLKRILNEIDQNAFLKIPSRMRSEIIEEGISAVEEVAGTDIRGTVQIIRGKYYSFQEFKTALEDLKSSYELSEKQFYSRIPDTPIFSTGQSQGYRHQVLHFYNPNDETQILDLSRYFLKSSRADVQRIALTASFGDMDYFKQKLELFFKDTLIRLGVKYPALTNEEKRLIEKYPYESLRVFWYKSKAEFAEWRLFDSGSIDGEADAFRHFVWAGFLTKDLGKGLAKRFLDARESEKNPDAPDRQMDEYNNKKGIEAALQLEKENRFNARNLYDQALEALKKKKLIVLQPTGNLPDDSSY